MTFDPRVVSYEQLVDTATEQKWSTSPQGKRQVEIARAKCAERIVEFDGELRSDADPKHDLGCTDYKHVPMTEAQAVRINARLAKQRGDPAEFLSDRQRALLQRVRERPELEWPNAIGMPLPAAWAAADLIARRR